MTHVVIIGSSISGLLAARVFSDYVDQISVIEKDVMQGSIEDIRPSLPQSHHQHILLLRGKQIFESLFPGFDQELEAVGAPLIDYSQDCELHLPQGKLPRFPSDLKIRPCRRPTIDWVIRRRLSKFEQIKFISGARVKQLMLSSERNRVTGVVYQQKNSDQACELSADLVIDTSGRGSRSRKWLQQAGYSKVPTIEVNPHLSYASQLYQFPEDYDGASIEVAPHAPDNPRAAGFWRVDRDQWLLTLIAMNGEPSPSNEVDFQKFCRQLGTLKIADAVSRAAPLGPIYTHKGTKNCWHHYHKVKRLPAGFIVMGDALCAFNPFHGQGMTIAAMTAQVLEGLIAQGIDQHFSMSWCKRYFSRAAKNFNAAWMVAISEDMRWPTTEGRNIDWKLKLSYSYMDKVIEACRHDPKLTKYCLEIANMVRSPLDLARPDIASRVFLKPFFRGRTDSPTSLVTPISPKNL